MASSSDAAATVPWTRSDRWAVVVITAIAAILRLVRLDDLPAGLHGDEAWTGLDAQRVLAEGWIGPYVGSALGQPAGPLYWAAPFEAWLGPSVLAVRLAMAVLGIATVPLLYAVVRRSFDRPLAVLSSLLLATGLWHLHFSRLGFMLIAWPLAELATLFFLARALDAGRRADFAAAGLCLGAGVYTYNAYPVFVVAVGLLLAPVAFGWTGRGVRRARLSNLAILAAAAGLAALPLLHYAATAGHDFFNHHYDISVFNTTGWADGNAGEHLSLIGQRAVEMVEGLALTGRPDDTDGAGLAPMLGRVGSLLFAIGLLWHLWWWRSPRSFALVVLVVLLPLPALVTWDRGLFRHSFGLVPFAAVLAATPLAALWRWGADGGGRRQRLAVVGVALTVAVSAGLDLDVYFRRFPRSVLAARTFCSDLVAALDWVEGLPGRPHVLLFSDRWSWDYETRRYLLPDHPGGDGTFTAVRSAAADGEPVVVLLFGEQRSLLDWVERTLPGGRRHLGRSADGRLTYSAYVRSATGVP